MQYTVITQFSTRIETQVTKNLEKLLSAQFSSVQLLSPVWLSVTLRTAGSWASLSITPSRGLLKLMSIWSVMPSSHLILCCPLPLCLQSRLLSTGILEYNHC